MLLLVGWLVGLDPVRWLNVRHWVLFDALKFAARLFHCRAHAVMPSCTVYTIGALVLVFAIGFFYFVFCSVSFSYSLQSWAQVFCVFRLPFPLFHFLFSFSSPPSLVVHVSHVTLVGWLFDGGGVLSLVLLFAFDAHCSVSLVDFWFSVRQCDCVTTYFRLGWVSLRAIKEIYLLSDNYLWLCAVRCRCRCMSCVSPTCTSSLFFLVLDEHYSPLGKGIPLIVVVIGEFVSENNAALYFDDIGQRTTQAGRQTGIWQRHCNR